MEKLKVGWEDQKKSSKTTSCFVWLRYSKGGACYYFIETSILN
jgi:hypothetical protein